MVVVLDAPVSGLSPESHLGIAFRGNIGQCHRSGRICSDTGSADADRDPGGFPMHSAEVHSESSRSGLGGNREAGFGLN